MSDSQLFRSVRRRERRGRSIALRIAKWGALVAFVVVVAIVVVLGRKAADALEPVTLQTLVLNDTDPDALVDEVEGTSVTLLVGMDRRAVPPPTIADATADPRGPATAQMIALVQTTPAREGTVVVTWPLDLMVLPTGQPEHIRLDQVQARAGADALLATVQRISEIRIDHYVEVDLAGVAPLVDAVGGVEVCLDEVMQAAPAAGPPSSTSSSGRSGSPSSQASPAGASPKDSPSTGALDSPGSEPSAAAVPSTSPPGGTPPGTASPHDDDGVSAGCQVLDGAAAAGFLSSRSDPSQPVDVQRQRVAEQHYLVSEVLERTRPTSVLANPLRTNRVLAGLDMAVTSDVDPGLRGLLDVADSIAGFDRNELIVRVVPSYRRSEDGDTLLYPDQATALFQALRMGESLEGVGDVTGDELGPEDVTVLVVNGVGTPGLAGDAATYFQARGFAVACAVNPSDLDPRATFDESQANITVQYLADAEVGTELVVEALGDLPVTVQEVERLPPMPGLPECRFNDEGSVDAIVTVGTGWPT